MSPLPWPPADAPFAALLLVMAAGFIAFHYRCSPARLARFVGPDDEGGARAVYLSRTLGALWLGLVPSLAMLLLRPTGPETVGLTLPDPAATGVGALIILALALPAVALAARRPDFTEHYPPIRSARWPAGRVALNALTWGAYLVAYELFFRGLLLFGLAARLDPWSAIALTTLIYVLAHLHKPGRETAGTLPMGVVFAAVTLWSGSIWAAVLGHWVIANTSDRLAARALARRAGGAGAGAGRAYE